MQSVLRDSGAIEAAQAAAEECLEKARACLGALPESLAESPARGLLDDLADEALRRDR